MHGHIINGKQSLRLFPRPTGKRKKEKKQGRNPAPLQYELGTGCAKTKGSREFERVLRVFCPWPGSLGLIVIEKDIAVDLFLCVSAPTLFIYMYVLGEGGHFNKRGRVLYYTCEHGVCFNKEMGKGNCQKI